MERGALASSKACWRRSKERDSKGLFPQALTIVKGNQGGNSTVEHVHSQVGHLRKLSQRYFHRFQGSTNRRGRTSPWRPRQDRKARVKHDTKTEPRKMARFKTRMNLIALDRYTYRGTL